MTAGKPNDTKSGSTDEQEKSAQEYLDQLLIQTVETSKDAGSGIERFKTERKPLEEFTEAAAPHFATHRSLTIGPYADEIADAYRKWNKTEVRNHIKEATDEYTDPDEENRPRLTEWLEENVIRVVEVRSTDRMVKTRWRWETSTDRGTVSWETKRTQDGLGHNSYRKLQSLVTEATGTWVRPPEPELRDGAEWARWIAEFVESYSDVESSRGPRTAALDKLTEWVSRNTAYIDMEDAVDRGGIRVDPAARTSLGRSASSTTFARTRQPGSRSTGVTLIQGTAPSSSLRTSPT